MLAFTSSLPLRLGRPVSAIRNLDRTASFSLPLQRQSARLPQQQPRFFCSANPAVSDRIDNAIADNKIMIFAKSTCPYCATVKTLFTDIGAEHKVLNVDTDPEGDAIREELVRRTGQRTVPNVFLNSEHIGGCDDTMDYYYTGKLADLLKEAGVNSNLGQPA